MNIRMNFPLLFNENSAVSDWCKKSIFEIKDDINIVRNIKIKKFRFAKRFLGDIIESSLVDGIKMIMISGLALFKKLDRLYTLDNY